MDNCVYFGVRTPKRESTAQCRDCKKLYPDLFKECTRESNVLMATSITVDKKGHTVVILPKGPVSDTELMAEDFQIVIKNTEE